MDIAIFGLGYVRAASTAYLSRAGHTVVGVDSNEGKAELINAGKSPVVEKDVDEMIAAAVAEGQLRATTDHRAPSATASWRSCASAHEPRQRRPRPHLY
jgi:GDP-mannose 6-dehydrogenase